MKVPEAFGLFHLMSIAIMCASIISLYKQLSKHSEEKLKLTLGTYAIVALILELTKQIVWSANCDLNANTVSWDFQWYAAPFQLCTTPIYACIISLFLNKKSELRKGLLSYVAFVTILGSIATIVIPDQCFTSTIVVNLHTMWLHYGSFVVSTYLIFSGEVELTIDNLRKAIVVFASFAGIATMLNIGVYQSGVLNGETFNMFYISPYFISELPVFDTIQKSVPYVLFLTTYIIALSVGATLIFTISKCFKYLFDHDHNMSHSNKINIKR